MQLFPCWLRNTADLETIYDFHTIKEIMIAIWQKNIVQRLIGVTIAGYFSLLNDKGHATATVYTKVIELVRERVYKFLTMENLIAYNESLSEGKQTAILLVGKPPTGITVLVLYFTFIL